jgi:hypothetical protein
MEYHRKQAKALVRAHRSGEREAVARAERVLGERARERFLLSDAEHVVAREQGHRTWRDLARARELATIRVDLGAGGEPVAVRVRKRGHRYTIDDDGAAVAKAGRPPGWLDLAEQAYALNVNRHGVVFVPAVEGGVDRDWLVRRVAECSAAVYQELVELADGRIEGDGRVHARRPPGQRARG